LSIAPATWTKNPEAYGVYSFGETGTEAKAFKVTSVSRTSDLKCTLECIEYDANCYVVDTGEAETPTIQYSKLEPINAVYEFILSEQAGINENGGIDRNIRATFHKPSSTSYAKSIIMYKKSSDSSWTVAGETTDTEFVIKNIQPGETYEVWAQSISYAGVKTSYNDYKLVDFGNAIGCGGGCLVDPSQSWEDDYLIQYTLVDSDGTEFTIKKNDERMFIYVTGTPVNGRYEIRDYPHATIETKLVPTLLYSNFKKPKISGLQIVELANTQEFNSKDCKITWNPVTVDESSIAGEGTSTAAGQQSPPVWFRQYVVKIYDISGNLRRTVYTSVPFYTYTFNENSEDGTGPVAQFVFHVMSDDIMRSLSDPAILVVDKSTPNDVTGLAGASIVGGVQFTWDKSEEQALKGYEYRITVGGVAGSWLETESNSVTRLLTSTEIDTLVGDNTSPVSTVSIEVKVKDVFDQTSGSSSASATAHEVSANLFQIVGLKSSDGVSGNVVDLFNGTTGSGGVVIT